MGEQLIFLLFLFVIAYSYFAQELVVCYSIN